MQLVYEKEKRLRMMMKMHGLGDTAYWIVMYSWFLLLYVLYMAIFVFFGSIIGLNMFRKNSYGEQEARGMVMLHRSTAVYCRGHSSAGSWTCILDGTGQACIAQP